MTDTQNNKGFSIRAVFIASGLSLFLLTTTFYIALKLGAAPWPIIFSVIVSSALIKLLNRSKHVDIHEVNVAQAGGSIGGLVAAGVAFTLPGIHYLNQTLNLNIPAHNPWLLGILITSAGLLGILLSVPVKVTFIDEENLPYPAGTAGAELIKAGHSGVKLLLILLSIGSVIGVFTLVRDLFFPAGFVVFSFNALGIYILLLPLPIAIGGGYILGPRAGFSWLAGAVIGWYLLTPLLHTMNIESVIVKEMIQNLGMGMVLGSGISFILSYVLPRLKKIFTPFIQSKWHLRLTIPFLMVLGFLGLTINKTPVIAAILALVGVWAMVAVAARMTGETNIDPLEQFGIFITLLISLIYAAFSEGLPYDVLFMIALFVSVGCAIAGDAGHDYKSAALIGTRFDDIIKIDLITVVLSGLAAPFVYIVIEKAFADVLFTASMPAPQAQLVAESISGFKHPTMFIVGFIFAFAGEFLNLLLPKKIKSVFLWMPFGIGFFLGPGLAIPIAAGAFIHLLIVKRKPYIFETGILVAAAVMGAEGIAGFSAGALTIIGIDLQQSALILALLFTLLFISSSLIVIYRLFRNH